jgi:hypothetical protein
MEARPVAAVKRVEGFKEGGAGVVGLGRTTVGSPKGRGGDGTRGGGSDKLGLGQGETGVQGTASGRLTEFEGGARAKSRKDRGSLCKTATAKRGKSFKRLQVLITLMCHESSASFLLQPIQRKIDG